MTNPEHVLERYVADLQKFGTSTDKEEIVLYAARRIKDLEQQLSTLREENASLIIDSMRYRLLRDADNYPGDEGDGPSKWDELCDLTLEDFDNWIDRNLMGKHGQELKETDNGS